MRQITRDLRAVPTSVTKYEEGRTAFREGVSLTDLPRSDWDLLRSGWLDELADTVQLLVRDLYYITQGSELGSLAVKFTMRIPPAEAPKPAGPAKPMSSYTPLVHHKVEQPIGGDRLVPRYPTDAAPVEADDLTGG